MQTKKKFFFFSDLNLIGFCTLLHTAAESLFYVGIMIYTYTHRLEKVFFSPDLFNTFTHCSEKIISRFEHILQFYTFTHCSGNFFFCRNHDLHFHTFTHQFEKVFFCPDLFSTFTHCSEEIMFAVSHFYTVLWKSFFFHRDLFCSLTLLHAASKYYFSVRFF